MDNQTKIIKDITTKLEHTQEILDSTESKYRQLVMNADCIILQLGQDGTIVFFNEFAQNLFGYTERQIVGKNIIGTIIPKKDSEGHSRARLIKDIKLHPERYANFENENITKDGRRIWVVWASKLVHNEQKNVTEILCIGHDITIRKIMENELRLFATALRNSNDAITVQDLEGNIISWNHGAERIYGYTEEIAVTMNIRRILPDHKSDEMMNIIERAINGEDIHFFETQRIAENNNVLNILLTLTLLKDETGKPFAITTTERDITERHRLEKEILDITERERELISLEMHDGMGQVLTGIAFKSKGLALKLKGNSPQEAKDALMISKLANKAIAQMRDIAKMLYPFDLETGGLVAAIKILATHIEKTIGINCRLRCGRHVTIKDIVEAKQIYRIVQEAITNALKHGNPKNIEIKLRLTKVGTVLTIENDGADFPKTLPKKKGLGLKIMKYRTNLIGGSLDISKGAMGGTIITCIFPNGSYNAKQKKEATNGKQEKN